MVGIGNVGIPTFIFRHSGVVLKSCYVCECVFYEGNGKGT